MQTELELMFSDVTETHVVDWLAYPHYSVPQDLDADRCKN
jgi:hypothetical protein